LLNEKRVFKESCSLSVLGIISSLLFHILKQSRMVFSNNLRIGMIGTKSFFHDSQGAFTQGLGLLILSMPTGCATSLQQAGGVAGNGCTSNLGRIASKQAI